MAALASHTTSSSSAEAASASSHLCVEICTGLSSSPALSPREEPFPPRKGQGGPPARAHLSSLSIFKELTVCQPMESSGQSSRFLRGVCVIFVPLSLVGKLRPREAAQPPHVYTARPPPKSQPPAVRVSPPTPPPPLTKGLQRRPQPHPWTFAWT